MSAKRRSKNIQGSQTSFEMDECSFGSRIPSASSKKSASSDNVDEYVAKNQSSFEMKVEPYATQTFSDDKLMPKRHPGGFCKIFWRGVRGLWKTKYTEDLKNQEMIVKITLRELAIYLVFVLILCTITFGMTSSTMFYFTKVMKDLFAGPSSSCDPENPGFDDVASMDDFFKYFNRTLLDGLYWEQFYNGDNVPESERGYIYFENKILGRPRLRQVRVNNQSCMTIYVVGYKTVNGMLHTEIRIHEIFRNNIKECYAPYLPENEFTGNFGLLNDSAWIYSSEETLNGRSLSGKMSSYAGGGYVSLLASTKKESLTILNDLLNNRWLDRGTRAVFIDFTVYNANINLFCIVTLLFEFPATGGCIPFSTYRTLKLLRYVTTMDYFVMACEGIFIVFIFYYFIEETIEIKKHKLSYFFDLWNIVDLVVICMGIVCITFNIYRTISVNKLLQDLLEKRDQYANFESLSEWQTRFNDFVAVGVFIGWIKIFKYITFNKTMTQLQSTLARCAKDIAGFSIMFFIVFLSYAQLGYLLFGSQVEDYSTYVTCIFTLFRIILGDFNFNDIQSANRYLGPLFFITFVFFVFFVLINMFLAIINDTYAEVKSDLTIQQDKYQISDYFKKGYDKMMNKLSFKREKIVDIQKALQSADTNQDSILDFEEWRLELKLRGHADAEIEAVFAKYDEDGDRVLNELERQKMQSDLEGQKNEINNEIEEVKKAKNEINQQQRIITQQSNIENSDDDESNDGNEPALNDGSGKEWKGYKKGIVRYKEFTILARRVDRVEHSIGSIVSKVDSVLLKLETMDKVKIKRRETMTQLLDIIGQQNISGFDGRILMERFETSNYDISRAPSATPKSAENDSVSIKDIHHLIK